MRQDIVIDPRSSVDPPLQTMVYRNILDAIIRLDLKPGERLVENSLAAQIGVSRLPVREALRQLEREQLVILRPRRGAVVAPLTARDAREIYTLRMTLEGMAARLAAENASNEDSHAMGETIQTIDEAMANRDYLTAGATGTKLHQQILVASNHRKLAVVMHTIGHHVARLRTLQRMSANESTIEKAAAGHRAIFEAISHRQAGRAEFLMSEHIRVAIERIVPILDTSSGELQFPRKECDGLSIDSNQPFGVIEYVDSSPSAPNLHRNNVAEQGVS